MPSVAFNFPSLPAPLAVFALLGSVALGLALALGAVAAWLTGRRAWARRFLWGAGGLGAAYVVALVGVSLASRERTLARGGEKYFCEIDCHLAYSVAEVRRGAELPGAAPRGEFWLVRLRTRFDEATISARRARDLPLQPNPRRLQVVDDAGTLYSPVPLPAGAETPESTDLTTPLRPGESYTTTLVFDLPRTVEAPRLLVAEALLEARLLIGNESAPLHRKTLLSLER